MTRRYTKLEELAEAVRGYCTTGRAVWLSLLCGRGEGDLWSAARLLFHPLAGGKAYFLGKGARQVGGILIMQMRGNVHQLFPGKQPPPSLLQAQALQIFGEGHTCFLMKDATEIAVAEIHDIGDHRHVQRFAKVPLHILLRPDNNLVIAAALLACLLV